MKRMHVHVAVDDLQRSIGFYSALFAALPSVVKADYAKWMLDDPRVNFAISTRGRQAGLDHLGIQVESEDELQEVYARLHKAGGNIIGVNMRHRHSDYFDVDFDVEVKDARHLTHIAAGLRACPSVETVDRAQG